MSTPLVITTCDRPQLLERSLASFQRSGSKAEPIRVFDDGRQTPAHDLLGASGASIASDRAQRSHEANTLALLAQVDPVLVNWAIVGPEEHNTVGANRNAMLLQMVGRQFVSVDDDVVGACFGPKDTVAEPDFQSTCPWRYGLFPDRAASLATLAPKDVKFVEEHAQYLGKQLLLGKRDASGNVQAVPHRIALTANGMVGDCGWAGFDLLWLVSDHPDALGSVTPEEATGREIVRSVPGPCATRAPWCQTMALGYDGRAFLPCFMPHGRGEDDVFGLTLRVCDPSALILYLPTVVLHAPPPRKLGLDDLWTGAARGGFSGLIRGLIGSWREARSGGVPEANLMALGGWLRDNAQRPNELSDLVASIRARQHEAVHGRASTALGTLGRPWQALCERALSELVRPRPKPQFARGDEFTTYLAALGELYCSWPALLEAARVRNRQGIES